MDPVHLIFLSAYYLALYVCVLAEAVPLEDFSSSDTCHTTGCLKAADAVLSNIDKTVAPCEDFYQFACGGWLKKNNISEDQMYVSVPSKAVDDRDRKLKVLLEKELTGTEPDFIVKLKSLYKACNDIESRNAQGVEPLKRMLKNFGGWPVVEGENWNEASFNWMETLFKFSQNGQNENIFAHVGGSSRPVMYFPDLGMPNKEYYLGITNDSVADTYFKLMVASANWLGANKTTSEEELRKVFNFEITLANFSAQEPRYSYNETYSTVKQLMIDAPQFDWLRFLKGMWNVDEIHENQTIQNYSPKYFKKFADYITKVEKRVVANYMMWRIVLVSYRLLSNDWRYVSFEHLSAITGQKRRQPVWKECISMLFTKMSMAMSSYFLRQYFKKENKDAMQDLAEYVHREFICIIQNNEWLDEETKQSVVEKALDVTINMGYPENVLNDSLISHIYRDINIKGESYYDIQIELAISPGGSTRGFEYGIDEYTWQKTTGGLGIDFTALVLQPPYFDKDRSNYLNFGALGSLVGYEVTSIFDNKNPQDIVNSWTTESDELFEEKSQCFTEQYCNYTDKHGLMMNVGAKGLATNFVLSYHGGLKAAYLAYQSWVKVNGEEPKLPELNYTQNQLFWISAANIMCEKSTPESLKLDGLYYPRIPGQFRINGQMSNIPQFSEDFQCLPGTPMNPINKCQVW